MKIQKRGLYFAPALFYCGIIFFFSGQSLKIKLGLVFWDKGAHWLEFAGLGFLLALGYFQNLPGQSFLRVYLTIMTGFLVGLVDELYQSLVPGRQCDWKDWIADMAGVVAGLTVFWLIYNQVKKTSKKKSSPVA